jgi:hypothetical protein
MKTDLPAPEEYYRLTRARELRRKVLWFRRGAALLLGPLLFTCGAAYLLIMGLLSGADRKLEFLGLTGIVGLAGAVQMYVWTWLLKAAHAGRHDADRLEAQHQARYGALPVRQAAAGLQAAEERHLSAGGAAVPET